MEGNMAEMWGKDMEHWINTSENFYDTRHTTWYFENGIWLILKLFMASFCFSVTICNSRYNDNFVSKACP